MYSCLPSFVLGFHGCDKKIAEKILAGKAHLRSSSNTYDWLGNGIYFWENNPERALQYANSIKDNPSRCREKITKPYVLGAIIDFGHCLNLLDSKGLKIIKQSYQMLVKQAEAAEVPLPENKSIEEDDDLLLRKLDCAVIELTHEYNRYRKQEDENVYEYDSVRGVFFKGKELYLNAGFKEKNHIQICVRNPNCIKGYFRVLDSKEEYPIP